MFTLLEMSIAVCGYVAQTMHKRQYLTAQNINMSFPFPKLHDIARNRDFYWQVIIKAYLVLTAHKFVH